MLVTYSQQEGIVQGAMDTFSGEKPCALCCKIAAVREATPDNETPVAPMPSGLASKWLQDMLPLGETRLSPPVSTDAPTVGFTGMTSLSGLAPASPPVPPPRAAV